MSDLIQSKYFKTPILVLLILLSGLMIMGYGFRLSGLTTLNTVTSLAGSQISLRIQEQISNHLLAVNHVRDYVENLDTISEKVYQDLVSGILQEYKGFQAINFISPDGHIIWINPSEGNEIVLGRDLHSHTYANTTFIKSEETGTDQITPPLRLWQGGFGIATYFPIRIDDELQGYVNGVIRISNFLDNYLHESTFMDYFFQVRSGPTVIYEANYQEGVYESNISSEHDLRVGDNFLNLMLVAGRKGYSEDTKQLQLLFYITGILFSLAFSILTYFNARRHDLLTISSQKIQKSEENYRGIFENSNDAIYQTSLDGKLVIANNAWYDLFGYTESETRQFQVEELYENPMDRKTFMDTITREGFVNAFNVRLKKKTGEIMDCILSANILYDDQGNPGGFQGLIHDMTQVIEQEKALKKALEEAQKSARLKNNIITNISHEIRTPLNSILGFSMLLYDEYKTTLTEDQIEFFKNISQSGKRLTRSISGILDYSVLESGNYILEKEKMDLVQIIHDVLHELRDIPVDNYPKVSLENVQNPCWITADLHSIKQAVNNIIHNAIQYSKGNDITIAVDCNSEGVWVRIIDNGIGILDDYMKNIYDTFSQESEGLSRSFEGLGLGLALSKKYIELNGGILDIKSAKNVGTTVTISLPGKLEE